MLTKKKVSSGRNPPYQFGTTRQTKRSKPGIKILNTEDKTALVLPVAWQEQEEGEYASNPPQVTLPVPKEVALLLPCPGTTH